jgi:PAS domain S-box-containing protein
MGSISLPSDLSVSDVAMAVTRSDGTFVHVTGAFCAAVGKRRDELIGRRADQTGLSGSTERMQWILDRLSDSDDGISYRRTFNTPSGTQWFDVHLHRTEELIVSTLFRVDAPDRSAGDEDAMLASFMNAVPLGFIVYDSELRIVRVNRRVEEMGRVRPEHLGQRVTDAFPEIDPDVLASIRHVLNGGTDIVNQQFTRPDGHEFLMHFFPIRVAGGVSHVGCLFNDVTALTQAQRLIFAQRLMITELSTPVLELDDGLLILPLVGLIDSERAIEITARLLAEIAKLRGRMVVIDVTGVPVVDSNVAHHLWKTVQAARLMGATTIISGISEESALALARLGIDLGDISPAGTLRDAVNELRNLDHTRGKAPTPVLEVADLATGRQSIARQV